tara:strand:+ start:27545 stop:28675 length:1131 start_codon:yes stop_codon:yes gene_type:complete
MRSGPRKPLYQLLASTLEERIESGVISTGETLPSERELCLEFNLSRQTVRNAIALLSEKGILDSRAGTGHFVRDSQSGNNNGRTQSNRNTRQIGVICPPKIYLEEPTKWSTMIALKGYLSQFGYSVALSVSNKDQKAGFFPCYQNWLDDGDIQGYIAISTPPALQKRLFDSGYPSLSLGYVWDDIDLPSIALDFQSVYREVLAHVHSLGHESILVTLQNGDSAFTRNVLLGIQDGAIESGIGSNHLKVCRHSDTAYDLVGGIRTALRSSQAPTSLILQDDEHLPAVMRFLEMEGVQVPSDLHITIVQITNPVGFNYSDQIAFFDFNFARFGQMGAQRILDLIAKKKPPALHQRVVPGKITDPTCDTPSSRKHYELA